MGMVCVDINSGHIIDFVWVDVNENTPVEFYGTTGGFVPTPDAVVEALKKLKEGK